MSSTQVCYSYVNQGETGRSKSMPTPHGRGLKYVSYELITADTLSIVLSIVRHPRDALLYWSFESCLVIIGERRSLASVIVIGMLYEMFIFFILKLFVTFILIMSLFIEANFYFYGSETLLLLFFFFGK